MLASKALPLSLPPITTIPPSGTKVYDDCGCNPIITYGMYTYSLIRWLSFNWYLWWSGRALSFLFRVYVRRPRRMTNVCMYLLWYVRICNADNFSVPWWFIGGISLFLSSPINSHRYGQRFTHAEPKKKKTYDQVKQELKRILCVLPHFCTTYPKLNENP